MDNDIAKQIKNGFDAFGGGIKEAGQKRIIELVNKQGYVAYKNEEAAKIFKNNPDYSNWECQIIDGEYRFYSPKENSKKEIDIIDIYIKTLLATPVSK